MPDGHPSIDKSIEILGRLIAHDTTSALSNIPLIEEVRAYLAEFGIPCRLTYDASDQKANLSATIGPDKPGGIVLSGHTDVVPTNGQVWTTDPFKLTERDAKLFGRGTSDMKGFVACVLAAVPMFHAADLAMPVHLAFSFDEEVGCVGVRRLIADLVERETKPAACIVGEPTGMAVVNAHKGKIAHEVTITGRAAHSSLTPNGVNAITFGARLVVQLEAMAQAWRRDGPCDEGYDVPFTTAQAGLISGGKAINIVPDECTLSLEIRHLPEMRGPTLMAALIDHANTVLLPEMRAIDPSTDIAFAQIMQYPGLNTDAGAASLALAKGLAGSKDHVKVAFGTEAGLFQQAGIDTVVIGPGRIDQAHTPDEFIAVDQLAACNAFLARLCQRLTLGPL